MCDTAAEGTAEAQSASLKGLLIRCISALAASRDRDGDGRLQRNSLRALIVVITHVDACKDADAVAVFEAMYTQGLGLTFTLLYEGWAVVLERSKNWDAAEKIFELGIQFASNPKVEDGFEATLYKGQRDLQERVHKRRRGKRGMAVDAANGIAGPSSKKQKGKRLEKPGYVRELLANDDGEELSFEEVRLMRYSYTPVLRVDPEPEQLAPSPVQPTGTVEIGQYLPSPVTAEVPAAAADAAGFDVFVDASPAAAAAPAAVRTHVILTAT